MKKSIVFYAIFLLASSNLYSQGLEEQMRQMELQNTKVQETKAELLKQVEQTVFKGYVDDVTLQVKSPVIKSVQGESVEIELPIEVNVPESREKAISSLISSHIGTNMVNGQLWYTFREFCYKNGNCQNELKTPYSPVVWDLLSESALVLKIDFLKQEKFSILIGQEFGVSGSVFFNGTVTFKFNVLKEQVNNSAKPTLRLVKYWHQWDLKNPKYSKTQTYKIVRN